MSNKKVEVTTSDGDSAVLDMALTKTTTHVVAAAGLGLLGGLLASRLYLNDADESSKLKDEVESLREQLNSVVREDGISQEDVDRAVAAGEARAAELLARVESLQSELGSRPTKAQLDAANDKLAQVSKELHDEVNEAYAQLTNLREIHDRNLRELTKLQADLSQCEQLKGEGSELQSAVESLLSVLSNSVGITSNNNIRLMDRIVEAQNNALTLRVVSSSAYDELDKKASQLAGLPEGDSILGHSDPAETYNKIREVLLMGAKAKDINSPYKDSAIYGDLAQAGSIFDVARILDSKKYRIESVASYWWMNPVLSYGTAYLNAIMTVIYRGKKGDLFGNSIPIQAAFRGLEDEHAMFSYSAANGVKFTEHFSRSYFTGTGSLGKVRIEGNSINNEFELSLNGLTLLRILEMLESPEYLYEGGHVRVSEGFLYRDYQARDALADAVAFFADNISGYPIMSGNGDSKLLSEGDVLFLKALLSTKELDEAVSVKFFL